MSELSFFSVLKNNLQCAFCNVKHCRVKYLPERKKYLYSGGTRYVLECKKEKEKEIKAIIRKKHK